MSGVDFSEAIREEFDLKGIIKVLFALCRAHCREEIDDTAMGPLLTLAFNRNYLFQQSLSRQKGTRTQKEKGDIRHVAWQEEANEVSRENPRLKKNAVADQVRINLGYKGSADTIARVIKLPS